MGAADGAWGAAADHAFEGLWCQLAEIGAGEDESAGFQALQSEFGEATVVLFHSKDLALGVT